MITQSLPLINNTLHTVVTVLCVLDYDIVRVGSILRKYEITCLVCAVKNRRHCVDITSYYKVDTVSEKQCPLVGKHICFVTHHTPVSLRTLFISCITIPHIKIMSYVHKPYIL